MRTGVRSYISIFTRNERDVFENVLRGSREPSIKTIDTILITTSETRILGSMSSVKLLRTVRDQFTEQQENGYISATARRTRSSVEDDRGSGASTSGTTAARQTRPCRCHRSQI